jgi:decaprenyl-phosphate phosphoribosyltransferase
MNEKIKDYFAIARPEHWIKNAFMLLGAVLAFLLYPQQLKGATIGSVMVGLVSVCLIASSNYVINEILDAARDREHPLKKSRPMVRQAVSKRVAYFEWILLGFSGLLVAGLVGSRFLIVASVFWGMGIAYNVRPLRTKEVPILDVLSEAVNNPLRLLMGWYAAGLVLFPPSSIVLAYWMFGAFGMAAKRLAEYREINNPQIAAAYRHSFSWYTEDRLVTTIVAYSSGFMFFMAVIVAKLHPELILSVPFLMILMGYIVKLTFEPHSIIQHPERLFRRPMFVLYLLFCLALIAVLSRVSLPFVKGALGIEGRWW